jgi:glutaconate CoA-transferase subunit A
LPAETEVRFIHPDDFRRWVKENKTREAVNKLMTEQETVARFVPDGAYIANDFSSLTRGPQALIREIIRQRKRDLWVCAVFTIYDSPLLVGAGCCTRIDVGFLGYGNYIGRAVSGGKVKVFDYTNGVLASRILAGARGIPFIPVRNFLGTDGLRYSGAKVINDPFTGEPVCLVPALNPDVFLVHVHQADVYGNARIFGTDLFTLEAAMASKRVIVSAEEIIEPLEFRKDPARTTIPYFLVDAVVHLPFGAYPGGLPGRYDLDLEYLDLLGAIQTDEEMQDYLEGHIYRMKDHLEFLQTKVGWPKLQDLMQKAAIKEGYR